VRVAVTDLVFDLVGLKEGVWEDVLERLGVPVNEGVLEGLAVFVGVKEAV
jgi:hypothetical protein